MTVSFACQPFVTATDVLNAKSGCALDAIDDAELIEDAIDQASDILSMATGGVISGICTAVVRPVALCDGPGFYERYASRDWRRRFGGLNSIPLRGPNVDVVSVKIDGATLAPTEYGLLNNKFLFRRSGNWPEENDLTLASTAVGTFEVVYRFGRQPDLLARTACTDLANELAKSAKGSTSSLPRGVTAATVQGASLQVRNMAEALREGDEVIPSVARFLSIWAPDGPDTRSGVWSPELEQMWELVEVEGPSGS